MLKGWEIEVNYFVTGLAGGADSKTVRATGVPLQLEDQLHGKLHVAVSLLFAGNEVYRGDIIVAGTGDVICMIQDVERFTSQLHIKSFGQPEVLVNSHIKRPSTCCQEGVSSAVIARIRPEVAGVGPIHKGRVHVHFSQIIVNELVRHAWSSDVGISAARDKTIKEGMRAHRNGIRAVE